MFANQTGSNRSNVPRQLDSLRLPAFALLAALFLGAAGVLAQQQPAQSQPAATPAQTTAPTQVPAGQPAESEAPQTLHLLVGRSIVITFSPGRIKRVSWPIRTSSEADRGQPYAEFWSTAKRPEAFRSSFGMSRIRARPSKYPWTSTFSG